MMIMSNDYAKGFKDGFAAGLEEGKKLAPVVPSYPSFLGSPGYCQVCGKNWGNGGVWGYVCNNQYCPSRAVAYSTGATGAVGSSVTTSYPPGANGPTGPAGSYGTMADPYELGN
jgi:hypothetical protein